MSSAATQAAAEDCAGPQHCCCRRHLVRVLGRGEGGVLAGGRGRTQHVGGENPGGGERPSQKNRYVSLRREWRMGWRGEQASEQCNARERGRGDIKPAPEGDRPFLLKEGFRGAPQQRR